MSKRGTMRPSNGPAIYQGQGDRSNSENDMFYFSEKILIILSDSLYRVNAAILAGAVSR